MNKSLLKVVIFVFCISFMMVLLRPNVMDEMGRWQVYGANAVPEIDGFYPTWEWEMAVEMFGSLWIEYKEEYLRDDISSIQIWFYDKNDDVDIMSIISLSEIDKVRLRIGMEYDSKKKKLHYEPIYILHGESGDAEVYEEEEKVNEYLNKYGVTREDVKAYQEYVVYDVVVKTWSKTYLKNYWVEKWKLKCCNTEDNTFQFPEE